MQPARRLPSLVLSGLLVLGLAACSAGAAPGWTYAPTPSPPPSVAPSVGPSGSTVAPSGSTVASAAPSSGSSAAPASGGTGGTTLNEVASGVQFQTTSLSATASQPFQIAFDNQDAGIPHNIQITDGTGAFVFTGDTVMGPGQITYKVPALAAGTYKFQCKWHPTMTGDLTVK